MKKLSFLIALAALSVMPLNALAATWSGESFSKTVYYEYGGKGSKSGLDAGNAKAIADSTVMAIEAGMLIEHVAVVLDTAVTGSTALDIGDDDDADGFVPTASITLATPGLYGWNAKVAGAYLRVQTAGVTDPADVYVVPNAKYYSAAKSMLLDNTTANTAGKFRVVVQGHKVK